jgi:ribosomal protein S12 methylthiotransferase
MSPRVALITLGCARNEVDSEELAGRLVADGWDVVVDAADADAVVVNTCAFVAAAKKDSIDAILGAAGEGRSVVAVGCLAERYGETLAAELPEATVLSFDDYPDVGARLRSVMAGETLTPHVPHDRRTLLPISPVDRPGATTNIPGHGDESQLAVGDTLGPESGPRLLRRRLTGGPSVALKLASGCDRRCSFCAIPMYRGSFVSRRPLDLVAEARFLAEGGAKELVLVSENSTSYGKDLGDPRLLESLLPELVGVPGIERVLVSYLQPAELRDSLLDVLLTTAGLAPYLELSFQHASAGVLRNMRRFGSGPEFLKLISRARDLNPAVGIRSNFIVGFPGETDSDLADLVEFLVSARLDAVGVFGYSAEDGTEAATLPNQIPDFEIRARVEHVASLVDELVAQRAEDRIGSFVEVLIERDGEPGPEGRAGHQGPEDSTVNMDRGQVGEIVRAEVIGTNGSDLIAVAV